ncbi:MAG TPA: hemerythrin domain-containing protein [Terriglobales bacterium]|nr:hemerythrin domain-containing protein [Terriglobales bacterium]
MLRDKNLVPLSHQHQHVLALCVRLDRAMQAGDVDLEAWQSEIEQIFAQEVAIHFAAEEKELFPVARKFSEMDSLVQELLNEHIALRGLFARAGTRDLHTNDLALLVETLAHHVRKEERQLFEGLQKVLTADELASLGAALQERLKHTSKVCAVPNPATRLRPKA